MSDVRLLRRAAEPIGAKGNFAPSGSSKESLQARNALGEYLDCVLIRPLHFSEEQQMARVEQSLNTMSLAERVFLEIEMTQRSRAVHSYDYDPLR
jgi:hypothetical protein